MAWTTPRTWVAGERLTALLLNTHLRDNLNAALPLGVDAWTAFTPTVKFGTNTQAILNNSRYMRVGRLVMAQYAIRFTVNPAAGSFTVTRPVPGRSWTDPANNYTQPYGTAAMIDVSTAAIYSLFAYGNLADQSDLHFRTTAVPTVAVTNTVPATWVGGASGTGDEFYALVTYEAAT